MSDDSCVCIVYYKELGGVWEGTEGKPIRKALLKARKETRAPFNSGPAYWDFLAALPREDLIKSQMVGLINEPQIQDHAVYQYANVRGEYGRIHFNSKLTCM